MQIEKCIKRVNGEWEGSRYRVVYVSVPRVKWLERDPDYKVELPPPDYVVDTRDDAITRAEAELLGMREAGMSYEEIAARRSTTADGVRRMLYQATRGISEKKPEVRRPTRPLDAMTEYQAMIWHMLDKEKWTIVQIAEKLGKSPNAIGKAVSQARQKLGVGMGR